MISAQPLILGIVGLALAFLGRSRSPDPLRRLRDLVPTASSAPRFRVRRLHGRIVPALLLGVVVGLVGLPAGIPLGAAAGWGAMRALGRLESASERRARQARSAELPAVLDLLAVCLRAGLPVGQAVDVVASALPGQLTAELATVATLYELGSGPAAWNEVRADPVLGPLARAAGRSGESGSALASDFERLATDHRAQIALTTAVHTRRLALATLAPLGLCFLPAFVCLGVVPVVLSVARQVLEAAG